VLLKGGDKQVKNLRCMNKTTQACIERRRHSIGNGLKKSIKDRGIIYLLDRKENMKNGKMERIFGRYI